MMTEMTASGCAFNRETVFAVCIFTFGGDAAALGQCLRALRMLKRDWTGMQVCVFDDGAAPLPYPPQCAMYERTHFPRRGNLNGPKCIQGELLCMMQAAQTLGAQFILKLDADTIVRDLRWVSKGFFEPGTVQVGISLHAEMNWASGMVYALRSRALYKMLRAAGNAIREDDVPEDMGMTRLVRGIGGEVQLYELPEGGNIPGQLGVAVGYDYQNAMNSWNSWQIYRHYSVVTFGNRNLIKDQANARLIMARQMERFLDVMEGGAGGLREGEAPLEAWPYEDVLPSAAEEANTKD